MEFPECIAVAGGDAVEQQQIGFIARKLARRRAGFSFFVRHSSTFKRFTATLQRAARWGLLCRRAVVRERRAVWGRAGRIGEMVLLTMRMSDRANMTGTHVRCGIAHAVGEITLLQCHYRRSGRLGPTLRGAHEQRPSFTGASHRAARCSVAVNRLKVDE